MGYRELIKTDASEGTYRRADGDVRNPRNEVGETHAEGHPAVHKV